MLSLSSLFSDHAVFQCQISIPIWGWTEPNCLLEWKFGKQAGMVRACPDGTFLFRLLPMQYGGPHELMVKNLKSGEMATIIDIMIGEVWVASGQSNMQVRLADTNFVESPVSVDCPLLRIITVPHCARISGNRNFEGSWQIATSDVAAKFSAVGYHFARMVSERIGVTVGVILSSWDGTVAEAWCSRESLVRNADYRYIVEDYEAKLYAPEIWESNSEIDVCDIGSRITAKAWKHGIPHNRGFELGWAGPDFDDSMWRKMKLPTGWVAAGENYNGVLWFRLAVEIQEKFVGQDWLIGLGMVDKQDVTYFNGVEIGATGHDFESQYWNCLREYRIPAALIKTGSNIIAVRAFSFMLEGGLRGPSQTMKMRPAGNPDVVVSLAGEWKYETEMNMGIMSVTDYGPGIPNSPYMLYENKIKPILPYAIRGVIWYQGESNEHKWKYYRDLMLTLIEDWRHEWGQGDFPFYQVQLANFREPKTYDENSEWALMREAQLQVAQQTGCGVAITIDCGEANDIHPKDKKTVGERLARLALYQTYGRHDVVPCGPVYRNMTIEGDKIRLSFDHCEGGLYGDCSCFVIADSSTKFIQADAIIDGMTVVVGNKQIKHPVAVRYAWADNPINANLHNGDGLPASPFRTDSW